MDGECLQNHRCLKIPVVRQSAPYSPELEPDIDRHRISNTTAYNSGAEAITTVLAPCTQSLAGPLQLAARWAGDRSG